MNQLDMFTPPTLKWDKPTSQMAGASVQMRATSHRGRLLQAFAEAGEKGLTAYEAAEHAGLLRSCYWKRISEMADPRIGLIEDTKAKRLAPTGEYQMVRRITELGQSLAISWKER